MIAHPNVAAFHAHVNGRLPLFIRHTFSDIIVAIAKDKLYKDNKISTYGLAIRADQLERMRASSGVRVRMDDKSQETLACTSYVEFLGLHIYTDAHHPEPFEHPFALYDLEPADGAA